MIHGIFDTRGAIHNYLLVLNYVLFLDLSMEPYTDALYSLSNAQQSHPTALSNDWDLALFPIAWSGGHPARSDKPWPFTFLVRELLFLFPYWILNHIFRNLQPGDRAWAKGVNGKWRRVQILDAGQPENCGVSLHWH